MKTLTQTQAFKVIGGASFVETLLAQQIDAAITQSTGKQNPGIGAKVAPKVLGGGNPLQAVPAGTNTGSTSALK